MEHTGSWLPVVGAARYAVSDQGRVFNTQTCRHPRFTPSHDGYPRVFIRWDDGRETSPAVHRLVLEAFGGRQPHAGWHTSHINGVRTDNRACNLAWESPADNNRRKVEHGTQTRGAEHPGAVLDDDRVVRIRERAATGETYVSISADVGTSNSLVARICKGKTWKHAGGPVQGYRHPSWEAA